MKFILIFKLCIFFCYHAVANSDFNKIMLEEGNRFADLNNNSFKTIPRQWNPYQLNSETVYTWQFPNENAENKLIGFSPTPNQKVRTIRRTENKIVYDVIYNFDNASRRLTSIKKTKKHNKFLSLLGCSFTYGNGLNDDETLNHHLASSNSEYYPYNYGIGSAALHMHLALLKSESFMNDVTEKNGAFVYVFIMDHVNRASAKNNMIENMSVTPFFQETENGRLINKGSFLEARPIYTNFLLWINRIFGNNILNGRIFPRPTVQDEIYFCKLAVESKKSIEEKFPTSRFIFYVHPFSGISDELKMCLLENKVLFKRGLAVDNSDEKWQISKLDSHPTGQANEKIAEEIMQFVKSTENHQE